MELGFTNEEIHKKTIPELKELLQKKLLRDENELVKAFEKEVQNVSIQVPKEISDLIYQKKEESQSIELNPKKIRIHFVNLLENQ
jgi:hypothetical protein